MAISLDITSTSNGAAVGSLTFSHTVGVGSNTILIVSASANNTTTVNNATVTSVTYNGVNLTQAAFKQETGNGNYASVWYLVAPATGTHNIVVTYSGSNNLTVGAGGISLFGVDQINPLDSISAGTTALASGTGTATFTTVAANTWAVDACSGSGTWSSFGAGQTSIFHSTSQAGSYAGPLASGANSMVINFTGFAQGAYTAAAFAPASGGGSPVVHGVPLIGRVR